MMDCDGSRLTGDRAIRERTEDRLGFGSVADRIARALVKHSSDNGLVIALDGAWGSGKSSLLYLLENAFHDMPQRERPTVINFRPWLIGERDSLLASLFREITSAMDEVSQSRGDLGPVTKSRARDAAAAARRFASAVGRAGEVVQFAGDVSGIAPVQWVGKGMKAAGLSTGPKPPPSLSESKDRLVKALRDLDHLFIVTIDDVDRLEPGEAVEVLRLARAVADFPNIVHVLCFDSHVLSQSVRSAAGIDDGEAFLEKIVQLTVTVPTPEPFQLRNWFTDELKAIGGPRNEKDLQRLREVIDWEGGRRLETPRSVVRALDSIRFMWPALQSEGADFADLVWLQLIKNQNLKLYRWIEAYLASHSVIALQIGQVDEADQEKDAKALVEADGDGFFRSAHYRHHFADHLPGIDANFDKNAIAPNIYQGVRKREQDQAIAERRLSSPDHYRLYFSLANPSHTITQLELESFWQALEAGPENAAAAFLELYGRVVLGSFSKADLLLERLDATEAEALSEQRSRDLLLLFSNVMDDTYRARPFDRFWVDSVWDRAQRLLPRLLTAVAGQRADIVRQMFGDGRALEWLTNVLRRETFAHGRYGDRPKPDDERILSAQELDTVSQTLKDRYSKLSAEELSNMAEPLNILFAWRQAGDEAGPRKLIRKAFKTDEVLVSLLGSMRGTVTSTGGRYHTLKRDSLEPFMNFDSVRKRVEQLANKTDDPALAIRAKALVESFRAGDAGF